MKIFNSNKHYSTTTDITNIKDSDFFLTQPTSRGLELVFQYLHNKYQTNILHPILEYKITHRPNDPKHHLKPSIEYVRFSTIYDIDNIKPYLTEAQKKPGDYREAYIIANRSHAIFMAYIKEGNKIGILYSDSRGTNTKFTHEIYKKTNIKVFTHLDGRQADTKSCFTDGVVMGRDITAINTETQKYRIPNILELLESKEVVEKEGLSLVRLPNELLKTAQISSFVDFHQDKSDTKKISKNENLAEFRERYTKTVLFNKGTKKISSYLQEKSIKYSKIIQIQYYINQIEEQTGPLSEELKTEFILKAKKILKSEEKNSLFNFAEFFLKSINKNSPPQEKECQKFLLHDKSDSTEFNIEYINEMIRKLEVKYQLPPSKLNIEFNAINNEIEKIKPNDLLHSFYYLSEIEENLLNLLNDKIFGLALTELLLLNANSNHSTDFWRELAKTNLAYAQLIIDNTKLIEKFALKKELYNFCYDDACLAKETLSKYPHLLSNKEKKALHWISTSSS